MKFERGNIPFLEGKGYTVLRLWEYEINKSPEKCIDRVTAILIE